MSKIEKFEDVVARQRAGELEHFQKCCSHSAGGMGKAVFLGFGFRLRQGYGGQVVSAQLQGFSNLLFRRSLAKAQKSSLRIGYNIFSNAPAKEIYARTQCDLRGRKFK